MKGESNGTGIHGKSIQEIKKANGNCCNTLNTTPEKMNFNRKPLLGRSLAVLANSGAVRTCMQ